MNLKTFDPVQRYNPHMVNIALLLAHLLGILLKLNGQLAISWMGLVLCMGFSVAIMTPITLMFYQGREAWPRWDQQFAHLPAIAIGAQMLYWWSTLPELPEAIALLWFMAHMATTGRINLAWTTIYAGILMLGYFLCVHDKWEAHPTRITPDVGFILGFMVLNFYLGVFSRFEAKRDALNLANQANLLASQRTLALANSELERISNHDPLTDLLNRRGFNKAVQNRPENFAILLIDIDDFKLYNDFFGHPAGDQCLKTVSDLLNTHAGSEAIISRHGGEEFVIALPNSTQSDSIQQAERIRQAIFQHAIPHPAARAASVVTVSIGIAHSSYLSDPVELLLKLADIALYEAKQAGRNGCRLFLPQNQCATYISPPPIPQKA